MPFIKESKISLIALASGRNVGGDLKFSKSASVKVASIYCDSPVKIDIQAMLNLVAKDYDISSNPNDYIYEAVRAVTAEVPNFNGDSFPREELLRFDHRLSKAIYQTFIGKPHHINHRADDPKTSRGVVLDASYNDLALPLDVCPDCDNKTAAAEGRDKSGIHCAKCGSTVKDEFVELLLAVDHKKDPTFAEGVKSGALDSLSMGCEAGYTDCSICENRARSVAQFCQHIKSGNKKKQFKTASGMAMSFEKCGEVVFTEISRVDQPADPSAKQREILSISHMPMAAESEMLVMAARMARLEKLVGQTVQDQSPGMNSRGQAIEHLKKEMQSILDQSGNMPDTNSAQRVDAFKRLIEYLEQLDQSNTDEPMDPSHQAQANDLSPQIPFKTVAESIVWAETSIGKLKSAVHQLTAEKEKKYKDAATESRPFYAWENATYDSQIKAHRQYISRLETYVIKARELEASGQPWGKSLTRSMSRFFANKTADDVNDQVQKDLQLVSPGLPPDLVTEVQNLVDGKNDVPGPMSIDDYTKKHEESKNHHLTPGEMGISDEVGGLPTSMASRSFESRIASELDALVDAVKENNVNAETKAFKFASAYSDLEVAVTKSGNVKVGTSKGTLFVVRPDVKPTDKAAAEKIGSEILSNIATNGIVDTVLKYQTILGPKMAQVLENHLEDFDGGREEGDKKSITEGGMGDGQLEAREKPEDSPVGEEHTDRKDEVREQRDQSNSKVVEKHMPDHKETLTLPKSVTDEEHSDKAEPRGKPKKDTQAEVILDHKDKGAKEKIKTMKAEKEAQMAPPAAPMAGSPPAPAMPTMATHDACTMEACAGKEPHEMHAEGTCHMCKLPSMECKCVEAQGMGGPAPMAGTPMAPPAAGGSPEAGFRSGEKTAGRLERLYKSRLTKVSEEASKKVAGAEKVATQKVAAKLLRALKLAAKRQALNMEFSPLKATMCDVLTNKLDIDEDSFYSGMDVTTASAIVEATARTGLSTFVDSLVKRASEFMDMSEDAFNAVEADVKNLLPISIVASAPISKTAAPKDSLRQAALNGNFAIAPGPTEQTISSTGNRDTIRSALGTTKVRRTSQALLKR